MARTHSQGKFKHILRGTGRNGTVHLYYNPPGGPRVSLPRPEGSPAFIAAYEAAVKGAAPKKPARAEPYTLAALIASYQAGLHFRTGLKATTQTVQRRTMGRIAAKFGEGDAREIEAGEAIAIAETLSNGPDAARSIYKILSQLFKHAIRLGWRRDNPVRDIERPKSKGTRHTWTDEEIAQFQNHWRVGTRQRLAFDLLLLTGQRRGDIVRLTHEHLKGGRLRIRQEKTGVEVDAPVQPQLRTSIAATPAGLKAVLISSHGKPYGSKGFSGAFKGWCRDAGMPEHCCAHGLRKAFARRMAEAGATAHEIMAAGGWATLAEVERYTKAADRRRLADTGMARTGTV